MPPIESQRYQLIQGSPLPNSVAMTTSPNTTSPAVYPPHCLYPMDKFGMTSSMYPPLTPNYLLTAVSSPVSVPPPVSSTVAWTTTNKQQTPLTVLVPVYQSPAHSPQLGLPAIFTPDINNIESPALPVNPLMHSTNMEIVWHGKFNELFSKFPHQWFLKPTESDVDKSHVFQDSAKVRFLCQHCGNAWTSMKGRVIFWIKFQPETDVSVVHFKLFGQKCQKCMPETFEHAMWYPEEVVKVVNNVYCRVGQLFYGFQRQPMSTVRRTGRPRTQHNSRLCQACAMRICREGYSDNNVASLVAA